jgi:MOSC domain-containing protein YiiM
MSGIVRSVNVAEVREFQHRGKTVRTGIWKLPAEGRVEVRGEGIVGDAVVDRRFHGGIDKAVYAYSVEDYAWWSRELGEELEPGRFGENLTTEGIDLVGSLIGERWRVGTALLEVSEHRSPCYKLAHKMGDGRFVRRFAKALRLGAYLRVIEPGAIAVGDEIVIVDRPEHAVTVQLLGRAHLGEPELASQVLVAPALSAEWREWAQQRS